jgi:hypothetical protein
MLTKIKRDTEDLLKVAFENYYLINRNARKGIMESGNPQQAPCEFPPAGLVAGVRLFETIRDALLPNDVEWLGDRFRVAAKARWARLVANFEDGSPEQVGLWRGSCRLLMGGLCCCVGSKVKSAKAPLHLPVHVMTMVQCWLVRVLGTCLLPAHVVDVLHAAWLALHTP